jgi:hypothetical protein
MGQVYHCIGSRLETVFRCTAQGQRPLMIPC